MSGHSGRELPGACDDCALAPGCAAYHTCVQELGWMGVGCRYFKPRPEVEKSLPIPEHTGAIPEKEEWEVKKP